MASLYALLVGINDYPAPIPRLSGAVQDVEAMATYLEDKAAQEGTELHLLTLKDQEATREALIRAFRQHLVQATQNDIVLFAFSGHGAQEVAHEAFWTIEPDRMNETLVCWDSRLDGARDLTDKELGKLISEVAYNDPQITIILDCCHSGSGSRPLNVRRIEPDQRPRTLDSYLYSPQELIPLTQNRDLERAKTSFPFQGRHILLSACRDFETAKEYTSKKRGAFSYFLLETLQYANSSLTYREVFKRTDALIRGQVPEQSPQLEATHSEDLDRIFLANSVSHKRTFLTVSHHSTYGWIMDAGEVHGIPAPENSETVCLALFRFDSPDHKLSQPAEAIGVAQVTQVLPQLSFVSIEGIDATQTNKVFKAVITHLPLVPLDIRLIGDDVGIALLQAALSEANAGQPSLYVRAALDASKAQLQVLAKNNQYWITEPASTHPLVRELTGFNRTVADQLVQRLEHIARWITVSKLSSPATSQIPADAIQLQIYENEEEIQASQVVLAYKYQNGRWQQPKFKLKLTNTSEQVLYCAVLDLTEQYAISAAFFEAGSVCLRPGEEAWALGGQALYASVPKELWRQGVTETRDILKLIVSTAAFDPRLLEQGDLDVPRVRKTTRNLASQRGLLNRLMQRVQTRAVSAKPEEESFDDWITSQTTLTVVRPSDKKSIPKAGMPLEIGADVAIHPHPSLQAKAQLTSLPQITRDLEQPTLPAIFNQDSDDSERVYFTRSRGSDPGLSVLELNQIVPETIHTVTPETPLQLTVKLPLESGEYILPVAYDGEFFIPLGHSSHRPDGTEILIERLPTPIGQGERSLGGSIRIFFQKILSNKLGLEFDYPQLAAVYLRPNNEVVYEKEQSVIQAQVAEAKQILLVIHGLLGDTSNLITDLQTGKSATKFIRAQYDLVLGFDYESFNTSVEETARQLKQCLNWVGLGENHQKKLDVVGYELGGLIGRWLIERENGNTIISHLVLVGTPNGGTPWATIQAWATTALGIGLNMLMPVAWPIKAIASLAAAIEVFDVTLDQMQPGSELLKSLEASTNPEVPYSLMVGTASVKSAVQLATQDQVSTLQRLVNKLIGGAADLTFFGQPNDLFASAHSLKHINQAFSSSVVYVEVPCDHFTYFQSGSGQNGLIELLNRIKP